MSLDALRPMIGAVGFLSILISASQPLHVASPPGEHAVRREER
jgi:hypothetical protein